MIDAQQWLGVADDAISARILRLIEPLIGGRDEFGRDERAVASGSSEGQAEAGRDLGKLCELVYRSE